MGQMISKLYAQLQENKITRDFFVRAARRDHSDIVSPTNSFDDIVKILKHKRLISEVNVAVADSANYDTAKKIDNVNPYVFKSGVEFELAKKKTLSPEFITKVREKVAKKLADNPRAYDSARYGNADAVEKADKNLRMKQVTNRDMVDAANGMKKVKGAVAEKANTKASKKENRKGKPKGVKLMQEDVAALQIPQPANFTNKEVSIMVDPETKQNLQAPKMGVVKHQQGSILFVDFGDGKITPVTINMVNQGDQGLPDDIVADFDSMPMDKLAEKYAEKKESPKLGEVVGKLKSYLQRRKDMKLGKKNEASDIVTVMNQQGEEEVVANAPQGQGRKVVDQLKKKGATTAKVTQAK